MSLYDVFKRVLQQRGEGPALQAIATMQQGTVADFPSTLALSAARLSLEFRLPMADSIMLATARAWNATLWTQDGIYFAWFLTMAVHLLAVLGWRGTDDACQIPQMRRTPGRPPGETTSAGRCPL